MFTAPDFFFFFSLQYWESDLTSGLPMLLVQIFLADHSITEVAGSHHNIRGYWARHEALVLLQPYARSISCPNPTHSPCSVALYQYLER